MFKLLPTADFAKANTGLVAVILEKDDEQTIVESIHPIEYHGSKVTDMQSSRIDFFEQYYGQETNDAREAMSICDTSALALPEGKEYVIYIGRLNIGFAGGEAIMSFYPLAHRYIAGTTDILSKDTMLGYIDQHMRILVINVHGKWELDPVFSDVVAKQAEDFGEVINRYTDSVVFNIREGYKGDILLETFQSWPEEYKELLPKMLVDLALDFPYMPGASLPLGCSLYPEDPYSYSAMIPIADMLKKGVVEIYGADGTVAYLGTVGGVRVGVQVSLVPEDIKPGAKWQSGLSIKYFTPIVMDVPVPYELAVVKIDDTARIVGKLVVDKNATFSILHAQNQENLDVQAVGDSTQQS